MSRAVRIALIVLVALTVVWLLFTIVFPAVEGYFNDPTLGAIARVGQALAAVI